MTVLGYQSRPDLDRVLAATNFIIDVQTAEIVESDIFFNTAFPWSTDAAGVSGRHDVQSIAVHEIGHFIGLGHSAIGETEVITGGRRVLGAEAVMFPIAFAAGSIHDRTLKPDDLAGITDIYGINSARRERGSISGKVTKSGRGVQGAHVVAQHGLVLREGKDPTHPRASLCLHTEEAEFPGPPKNTKEILINPNHFDLNTDQRFDRGGEVYTIGWLDRTVAHELDDIVLHRIAVFRPIRQADHDEHGRF
jgi:hypothetical protein